MFDTWMALLAGDRVWHDRSDGPPSTRERAAAALMLAALAGTVLVQWVALVSRSDVFAPFTGDRHQHDLELVALAGLGAAALLASRPILLAAGRRPATANFWWSLCWRGAAYLAITASTAALLPRFHLLGAVPLGLVGGTDAIMTMWALGLTPQPTSWLKRLLLSGLHFGALGALIGTVVFDPDGPSTRSALGVYVAMWTAVAVGGATVIAANRFTEVVDAQRAADREELRARERELRVHWLHDDVLSEVRLASLRIEADGDVDATRRELRDLDHRLRLRQLEESMRGGRPHLYEIIQPHLRRAQSLGIRIDRVPALDQTDRRVDEPTGQLLHRVVSNLVSNAINAGATRLSLAIDELTLPPSLVVAVTDDAGGFSLDDVDPGRGLSLLSRDLGTDAVRRDAVPGGSVVTVRVPIRQSLPPPQEAHT